MKVNVLLAVKVRSSSLLGRIGIAAQMLGIAKGAFEKVVPYAYERYVSSCLFNFGSHSERRKQFGQAVGDFQAMGHQFADVSIPCPISAGVLSHWADLHSN